MTPGTRVRLLEPTINGWKGCGTVVEAFGLITFVKDGTVYRDSRDVTAALPHQIAAMRDQTPNPDHKAVTP